MNHENKLWKQIVGGLFVVLGLGIYVVYFLMIGGIRKWAASQQMDPAFINAMTAAGGVVVLVANWPSVLLIGFGVPWLWNTNPIVRVWSYRVLTAFFVLGAAGAGYLMFVNKSPATKTQLESVGAAYLIIGLLFYWRSTKLRAQIESSPAESNTVSEKDSGVPAKPARTLRKTNFALCNVLDPGTGVRRSIWQFDVRNGAFALNREQSSPPGQPLPANVIDKSWTSLWQKKLNVAWLPPEDVFIRVAQLPQSSPEETRAMVELQLEKLSPIPVTQAVWSMHVLPHAQSGMQTIAVTIASRGVVEQFLGQLESQGYLADRLELPLVDELQMTSITDDGAWIYPEARGRKNTALVAWWYGGVLQNLDLLTVPAEGNRAAALREQLMQMAWAGELEGWLTAPPRWHLVATEEVESDWMASLKEGLDQAVEVSRPTPSVELAARTARRSAQADPNISLLPAEYAVRYHQQFVDRLWMRGLGAVLGLYAAGLIVYFVAVWVLGMQTRKVEADVSSLGSTYTNTLQLSAQLKVLKERQELKFAALDSWEAVAETLPPGVNLDTLNFSDGRKLSLVGNAPTDQQMPVTDFAEKLRKFTVRRTDGGQNSVTPLFDPYKTDFQYRSPNPSMISWTYQLELKRVAE